MTVMSTRERSHLICELETRQIPTQRSRSVLAATAVAVGLSAPIIDEPMSSYGDPSELREWRNNGMDDSQADDADPELDFYTEMRQVVAKQFGLSPAQVHEHREVIDRYIRESGATLWAIDHPDSLRSLLGFDNTRRGRRMSFLDTDDDEHDLLGSLGMHIVTI
jgi:hypothetical protein